MVELGVLKDNHKDKDEDYPKDVFKDNDKDRYLYNFKGSDLSNDTQRYTCNLCDYLMY